MIKKLITRSALGLSLSFTGFAGTMGNLGLNPAVSPFYIGAYGGYGSISGSYGNDGNFAQGRLALGVHANTYKNWLFGVEVGVQSGNTMRLNTRLNVIDDAGGLLVQSTLKPLVDFLATVHGRFQPDSPLSYILKGGIAYRQLDLNDRSSSQDSLSKVNGEFQAGLGYNLTPHVMLSAFYQGIYSNNNVGAALNSVGDVTIANIPTQQAGFLGVDYSF